MHYGYLPSHALSVSNITSLEEQFHYNGSSNNEKLLERSNRKIARYQYNFLHSKSNNVQNKAVVVSPPTTPQLPAPQYHFRRSNVVNGAVKLTEMNNYVSEGDKERECSERFVKKCNTSDSSNNGISSSSNSRCNCDEINNINEKEDKANSNSNNNSNSFDYVHKKDNNIQHKFDFESKEYEENLPINSETNYIRANTDLIQDKTNKTLEKSDINMYTNADTNAEHIKLEDKRENNIYNNHEYDFIDNNNSNNDNNIINNNLKHDISSSQVRKLGPRRRSTEVRHLSSKKSK